MSTRRMAKVAEAIREVVSTTILFELRDPRVQNVTVLHAEVPHDLRTARVYISIMGNETEQNLCLHGLNSSRGFLQKRLADRLDLRYTPVLTFVVDPGVKKSLEASRLLREIASQDAVSGEDEPARDSDFADDAPDPGTDPPGNAGNKD